MKLLRTLLFAVTLVGGAAWSQTSWLGIYLQDAKIGYSSYQTVPEGLDGKPGSRSESMTVISSQMLGSALSMKITSTSWLDPLGAPVRMIFVTESSDRKQTVQADFTASEVSIRLDNNGVKTLKRLPIPKGARIIDDATAAFVSGERPPVGKAMEFYVLDPTTVSLIKNTAVYKGKTSTNVKGQKVDAEAIEIQDPRATTTVFVSAKGDVVKVEGPLGMQLIPEPKEEAMALAGDAPKPDIAFATALRTTPPIERASKLTKLELSITGLDLKRLPSDAHQTVTRSGDAWRIVVHPVRATVTSTATIAAAAKDHAAWIKPAMHMPCGSKEFRALAKKVVGKDKTVLGAATKVRNYVNSIMKPNAGIGVLRDATEVLATKEGVCRDYAILTATLLRAAGIPARLCSGLLAEAGQLFYHAWVEVWTGKEWIGYDSTRPEKSFSAAHIKLAHGNVEEAFVFFVLDGAKVTVLETAY